MPTGQKLLDSLAETWDFFFSDVLPTLQAIFYPVQVSGPCSHGTPGPPCRPSWPHCRLPGPRMGTPFCPSLLLQLSAPGHVSEPAAHP